MNPAHLYTLAPVQEERYSTQPDGKEIPDWYHKFDEYEHPPYIPHTTHRFWYNTESTCYTTHWHDAQELIMPIRNEYTVTVQHQAYALSPGDIFLIPPGELHSLEAPKSGSRFIFLFETGFVRNAIPGLSTAAISSEASRIQFLLENPIHISSQRCPSIYAHEVSLILSMAEYYWGNTPAKQMHVFSCLLDLFSTYIDYVITPPIEDTEYNKNRNTEHSIPLLLQHLQDHYAENISLDEAASFAGLSRYYFSRTFRDYTGQTFTEYLNRLRIQKAANLLKNSDISIADIPSACGYDCTSTFVRNFRKFRGCSPSEYRKYMRV